MNTTHPLRPSAPQRLKRTKLSAFLITAVVIFVPAVHAQRTASRVQERRRLVRQIAEDVKDRRVLNAIGATQRHLFVPEDQRANAYLDTALPIGSGATISPPRIVAFMTEQVDPRPTDRVLEIGTGSGYQAAVLSPLVDEVYTIEIIEELGNSAAERLERLKYDNVHVRVGDGFQGWPEKAPFDKIIVTCSPEDIPTPLVEQLREGGQMVIPLGERFQQSLCLVTKRDGKLEREILESTFFIPMTGVAETLRSVRGDDGVPRLVNGSFEEQTSLGSPTGFYYVRQAEVVTSGRCARGRLLSLLRESQVEAFPALQSFGLDGQRFARIEISAWARPELVVATARGAEAGVLVRFYSEGRELVGSGRMGPWVGSSRWARRSKLVEVPPETSLMVIAIGLFGATGNLSFDGLEIRTLPRG